MKKILTLLGAILFLFHVSGQEVISSAGETQTVSGYEVSWTLGETVISTISDGTNTLTQGFHQSKLIITAISELSFSEIGIKVFPNPTQDFVVIQFTELTKNPSLSLFDLTGKKLESKIITSTRTELNLKNYVSGSYILKLNSEEKQPIQTYKIIKQ